MSLHVSYAAFLANANDNSSNTPFVSLYGVTEREPNLDALSTQFQYGIPSLILTSTTVNGGTITNANSNALLNTSGTAGAVAGLQSKASLEYISGHEGYAYFTAAFTGAIANNTQQYIGILDSNNGFGVGFNGTSFGVVRRSNGVDTFTSQANFNGDTLNGTGASQFTYNPAMLNVFRIAYGWLGASIIKFQIMGTYGNWITFHTIQYPNTASVPSIGNPMLPMSAQVYDIAGGNNLQLQTAGWNMGVVTIQNNVGDRFFCVSNQTSIPVGTETHLLTLLNQNTYQSAPNKVSLQIVEYTGMVTSVTTASPIILRIYQNATVTGTSFSSVATGSVAAVSTTGTFSAGTGTLIAVTPLNSQGKFPPGYINPTTYNITANPGDTITVTAQLFATTQTVIGSIAWMEGF